MEALIRSGVVAFRVVGDFLLVKEIWKMAVEFSFTDDAMEILTTSAVGQMDDAVRVGLISQLDDYERLVRESLDDVIEGSGKWKNIKTSSAEDVNKWWKDTMGYDSPPYKPGTTVSEIELLEDTTFVRVYDGNTSDQFGGWVMRLEDIKGLTPKQIQDQFALPSLPQYVTDVNLPAGTHMRTGIVNPLEGWGNGGGYNLI